MTQILRSIRPILRRTLPPRYRPLKTPLSCWILSTGRLASSSTAFASKKVSAEVLTDEAEVETRTPTPRAEQPSTLATSDAESNEGSRKRKSDVSKYESVGATPIAARTKASATLLVKRQTGKCPPPILSFDEILSELDNRLAREQKPRAIWSYLKWRLNETQLLLFPEPQELYDQIIQRLITHRYLHQALALYNRMLHVQGLIPIPQTSAKILAIALADCKTEAISAKLKSAVEDPQFTELDFMDLLSTMVDIDVPFDQIVRVMEHFLEARGENFNISRILKEKVIKAQAKVGRHGAAVNLGLREKGPAFHYVDILKLLTHVDARDEKGINIVLEAMKKQGVKPDIDFFNAMISRALKARSLRRAFATYGTILKIHRHDLAPLLPNEETFILLFSSFKYFQPSAFHTRGAARILTPRELYGDLLYYQIKASFNVSSSLLLSALSAFLRHRDYAGAHFVLKSFPMYQRPISLSVYYFVLRHLIRRLRFEIKSMRNIGEVRWADRFLDLPDRDELRKVEILAFSHHETTKILRAASGPKFSLTGYILDSSLAPKKLKYQIPTTEMIVGLERMPDDLNLRDIPLQRLLRRAVRATMDIVASEDQSVLKKSVWRVLSWAKEDMMYQKEFRSIQVRRAGRLRRGEL